MTSSRLAALLAAVYLACFSFAWYALESGNSHVVAAVLVYLLLVLAVLGAALYKRTKGNR